MPIVDIKKYHIIAIVAYTLGNSLITLSILKVINTAISQNLPTIQLGKLGMLFLLLVLAFYIINVIFYRCVTKYVYSKIYNLEIILVKLISGLTLAEFEKINREKIFLCLEDLRSFIFFPSLFINVLNSSGLICVAFLYLAFQSWAVALSILVAVLSLIGVYIFYTRKYTKTLKTIKEKNEDYSSHVTDLFEGFKNFQLDSYKKNELLNGFLTKNRTNTKIIDIELSNKFNTINLINQFGVYMLLGIAMFLFPIMFGITGAQIFSIVFLLLFISAPIQRLLVQQQLYHRMKLSFTRVKELFTTLAVSDKSTKSLAEREMNKKEGIAKIQLDNIEYKHANFKFGPVTLNIEEEQVVFVIGGNGSGKTTFLNILTNLYIPCAGNITINDRHKISEIDYYRDSFSAVFIDSKISRFNYSDFLLTDNDDYKSWLRIFKMDNVVGDFTQGALRRSFSKGQEKRVLLILALLENKQFLVLDEWAADQDPQFRKYFYEVIVPLLKSKGKTVIAVSHDDKYFNVADRIVKFEEGKIVQDLNAADWYKYKEIF